ncbi:MAG: outer membrane beta-barrel domain-containing protein, partial [Gammaproteobacteria bacterium]|nr:outer membrane beta-barrel domain-containing protein [Gammaproteobacteria bacterium]
MENWFRNLFLSLLILAGSFFSPVIFAAEQENTENPVLIRPELERSLFNEAQIDGDDFEILLVAGFLSIEDFGVNPLLAVRLNYHVNETVFVQLAMAQSKAGETSYEILSGGAPLLTDAEKDLRYYSINIGYNLFPGEAFLSDQTTYNTVLYLVAGMGTTDFAGSD